MTQTAERRDATASLVMAAALRQIVARGSASVSVADIGQEAGYSRAIVNHTFGTKRQLLEALVEELQRTTEAATRAAVPLDGSGLDAVLAAVRVHLEPASDDAPAGLLVLWREAATGDPHLRRVLDRTDAWLHDFLVCELLRGQADGSVRRGLDPAATAAVLTGTLRGLGLQGLGRAGGHHPETGRVVAAVRVLLARRPRQDSNLRPSH